MALATTTAARPAAAARRHPALAALPWRTSSRRCAARALQPPVVAAAQGQRGSSSRGEPPSNSHLQDPAKIEGSSTAVVPVQDRGGSLSLDAYMRLPTEQYNELDPAMISSLGGSRFLLKVPRVTLFNVWVEPEVVVDVRLAADGGQAPGVVFESGSCRLKGSELLERLELDKRFVLFFHTMLTWHPAGTAHVSSNSGANNGGGNGSGGVGSAAAAAPASSAVAAAGRPPAQASITAKADVQVWSEVVGPFRAIPRAVLQATGNAVMGALLQALLPVFMRKLADDYVRWAGDAAYRARRAAASPEVAAPQQTR